MRCAVFENPKLPAKAKIDARMKLPGISYCGILDTGSVGSAISKKVITQLNLTERVVRGAGSDHSQERKCYDVMIIIPLFTKEPIVKGERIEFQEIFRIVGQYRNIEARECSSSEHFDVIIGMDILKRCSLYLQGDQFSLSL